MLSWKINVVFIRYKELYQLLLKPVLRIRILLVTLMQIRILNFQIKAQNLDWVTVLHFNRTYINYRTGSLLYEDTWPDINPNFRASTILKINCFEDTQKEEH